MPELAPQLKQLRLSGILDSLEARNRQAIESKLAYTEFLAMLVGDEVARRENKKFDMRLRRAQFRTTCRLDADDSASTWGSKPARPDPKRPGGPNRPNPPPESAQGNGSGASSRPVEQTSAANPSPNGASEDRLNFLCAAHARGFIEGSTSVPGAYIVERAFADRWNSIYPLRMASMSSSTFGSPGKVAARRAAGCSLPERSIRVLHVEGSGLPDPGVANPLEVLCAVRCRIPEPIGKLKRNHRLSVGTPGKPEDVELHEPPIGWPRQKIDQHFVGPLIHGDARLCLRIRGL